jgi:hypothetical protein
LRQALRAGPVTALLGELRQAAAAPDDPLATAAAETLAIHGEAEPAAELAARRSQRLPPTTPTAAELCDLLALVPPAAASSGAIQDWLRAAAGAPDRGLRNRALHAAAWTRQPWLLPDLRRRCGSDPEALLLLGILGEPADLRLLLDASRQAGLGMARFEALGAYGHPGSLDALMAAMAASDQRAGIAAAAAFARMSGVAPWSSTRVKLSPPEETDALEAEFAEDAHLPLAQIAIDWKRRNDPLVSGSERLQGGRVLDERLTSRDLDGLTLRAAADVRLLAHFRGLVEESRYAGLLPLQ